MTDTLNFSENLGRVTNTTNDLRNKLALEGNPGPKGEDHVKEKAKDNEVKDKDWPPGFEKDPGHVNAVLDHLNKLRKADPPGDNVNSVLRHNEHVVIPCLQAGIMRGETRGIAEVVKRFKDDPQTLEKAIDYVEQKMRSAGANIRLHLHNGKVLIHADGGNHAVEVGADGKPTVRVLQSGKDGAVVLMENQTVLRPRPEEALRTIGQAVVHDISKASKIKYDPPQFIPIK